MKPSFFFYANPYQPRSAQAARALASISSNISRR